MTNDTKKLEEVKKNINNEALKKSIAEKSKILKDNKTIEK